MPSDRDYEAKIRQYQLADLWVLWQQIQASDTPGWEAGKAFEYLVIRAFELEGAEVKYPYSVYKDIGGKDIELEQIDGVIYLEAIAFLVECKDWKVNVDFAPIAKLSSYIKKRPPVTMGCVFSIEGFTIATVEQLLHSSQLILLWDGNEVAYALQHRVMREALRKKYRYAIEYGLPDLQITTPGVF